jgi:hypothetical protein
MMRDWAEQPSMEQVEGALRLLAKWRSSALSSTQIARMGAVVQAGLFEGMDYNIAATEGSLLARLMGSYEAGLVPHIESIVASGINCVIDVGCAEGYYAVGLARRYPHLRVHAYDISETAQAACRELAARNGVSERVIVGGEFKPTDFEAFASHRPLVLVDAEGAELDILRPDVSPALASMTVIVETHDVWRPGARNELITRFTPTHAITQVDQQHTWPVIPDWVRRLSELDLMLVAWEWRHRLTPWLVMRPKTP